MAKLVIVVEDDKNTESVARDVAAIPGVSVTSQSGSFVDVETTAKSSVKKLKRFTAENGLSLHQLPEAELMEPIPTSKIF